MIGIDFTIEKHCKWFYHREAFQMSLLLKSTLNYFTTGKYFLSPLLLYSRLSFPAFKIFYLRKQVIKNVAYRNINTWTVWICLSMVKIHHKSLTYFCGIGKKTLNCTGSLAKWVEGLPNGPGDLGSIPGHGIPKTLKMVLDTSLLNTWRYKVRIKWSNPGKGVAPSPTPLCSSYWKGSLRVTFYYGR